MLILATVFYLEGKALSFSIYLPFSSRNILSGFEPGFSNLTQNHCLFKRNQLSNFWNTIFIILPEYWMVIKHGEDLKELKIEYNNALLRCAAVVSMLKNRILFFLS